MDLASSGLVFWRCAPLAPSLALQSPGATIHSRRVLVSRGWFSGFGFPPLVFPLPLCFLRPRASNLASSGLVFWRCAPLAPSLALQSPGATIHSRRVLVSRGWFSGFGFPQLVFPLPLSFLRPRASNLASSGLVFWRCAPLAPSLALRSPGATIHSRRVLVSRSWFSGFGFPQLVFGFWFPAVGFSFAHFASLRFQIPSPLCGSKTQEAGASRGDTGFCGTCMPDTGDVLCGQFSPVKTKG